MVKIIGLDFETALLKFTPVSHRKTVIIGQQVPISFQLYSLDVKLNPKSATPGVFEVVLERLKNYFSRRTSGSIFVTANLPFDVAVLSQVLQDKNITISCFYSKNRMIKAVITDTGNRKWKMVDLFNIYGRVGLNKIGQIIGLEKLEKPKWLGIRPPQNEEEMEYLKMYGLRDAEIHYHAYSKIVNFWNIKPVTAGGLALKHFKKQTGFTFNFPNFPDELLKKWSNCYRGGRCESFVRGSVFQKVYYYDVNAMYPYVMSSYSFPYIDKSKEGMFVKKYSVNLDREGIAKAIVFQDHDIPPLGVKRPVYLKLAGTGKTIQERLVFPKGTICDWFTYPELRYIEETGHGFIIRILEAYEWKHKCNPFKFWISDLLKLREENPDMKHLIKIPLNSLYGKLAEKRRSKIVQVQDGKVVRVFPDLSSSEVYAKHSCLPWAAYITSYARLHLHSVIMKCDYKVYYCDTDSVFTSHPLPTSNKIGELSLKYETKNTDQSVFIRSKFYVCGELVRCRGWNRPPPATTVKTLILKGKIEIDQTEFASFLQALRLHIPILTEIRKKKVITTGEDGKRCYIRHLDGKDLLVDMSESEPIELKEGWF